MIADMATPARDATRHARNICCVLHRSRRVVTTPHRARATRARAAYDTARCNAYRCPCLVCARAFVAVVVQAAPLQTACQPAIFTYRAP